MIRALLISTVLTTTGLLFMCTSCTMFSKQVGGDELEKMEEDVLKKGEGIDITIKPVEKEKK